MTPSDQWSGIVQQTCGNPKESYKLAARPAWFNAFGYQILPSGDVESHVLANSGARPLDRGVLEKRIVFEVATRTGRIKNCVGLLAGQNGQQNVGPWGGTCSSNNAGGWPVLTVNKRTL